jgi:N6-L-threonylcarbamoyladenine synthase
MRILSIETSCDETAVCVLEATGTPDDAAFTLRGNALLSQIEKHREFGGVFPTVAKREHQKNLIPLLEAALQEAGLLHTSPSPVTVDPDAFLNYKEEELRVAVHTFLEKYSAPDIDIVAVTYGPGLEPALWVGIVVAETIAKVWNKPLVPINHMEGHVLASLVNEEKLQRPQFPVLALLISGGHTELVLMKNWLQYELVGQTLDDAVGEAFDKVARMLDLPYPGGPQISRLAESHREDGTKVSIKLPRPMIKSNTCDFSFSGLKTAVLYLLKNYPELTPEIRKEVAREFEDAVSDVLVSKTKDAIAKTSAHTVVVGGGVSANKEIRRRFLDEIRAEGVYVAIPEAHLSTDNAVMIAIAAFYRASLNNYPKGSLVAKGNLSLA